LSFLFAVYLIRPLLILFRRNSLNYYLPVSFFFQVSNLNNSCVLTSFHIGDLYSPAAPSTLALGLC
jgi:hypothetical protein